MDPLYCTTLWKTVQPCPEDLKASAMRRRAAKDCWCHSKIAGPQTKLSQVDRPDRSPICGGRVLHTDLSIGTTKTMVWMDIETSRPFLLLPWALGFGCRHMQAVQAVKTWSRSGPAMAGTGNSMGGALLSMIVTCCPLHDWVRQIPNKFDNTQVTK